MENPHFPVESNDVVPLDIQISKDHPKQNNSTNYSLEDSLQDDSVINSPEEFNQDNGESSTSEDSQQDDIVVHIPENIPEYTPEDIPEDVPENTLENTLEEIPENKPQVASEETPEDTPEDITQNIPEGKSQDLNGDIGTNYTSEENGHYSPWDAIGSVWYEPGVVKPVGEVYTKTIIVPKTKNDSVEWISQKFSRYPNIRSVVYAVDDVEEEFHTPMNKGHEVMAYLTFIIEHYDKLSDVNIFLHSHRFAWHNNNLLDNDAVQMITRLSPERVQRVGYMNMRCHWKPGCPSVC
jgi:hypothetical protein